MVKKGILISGREVVYFLKTNRKARNLRLTVYQTGEITVTLPRRFPAVYAEKFLLEKSDWLMSKLKLLETTPALIPNCVFGENEKNTALKLINEKLFVYNVGYNFTYKKVMVRDQKTIWGSCSRRGTLSFNFRIIYLPNELVDYLIVHELCHLKEMNHSKRFWELVGFSIPDYLPRKLALRSIRCGKIEK